MPPTQTASTLALPGFASIADRFDLCLCDVWGVVHNGVAAFAEAVAALVAMRERGIVVVLVTNAPRPAAVIEQQLDGFGVPRSAWDAIVTSGDVCRSLIAARAGQPMFRLGPERDRPLVAGLDAPEVAPEQASYVLCTGLLDDETDTAETYADLLAGFAARGLEMICANPDLVVERGGRIVPCAGSVALAYEEIGGRAIYAGKPHAPIYTAALALAEARLGREIARERICGIGDAIRTDIAGAEAFGITGIMVLAGIHAQDLMEASWDERHGWFGRQSHRPAYALPHLVW
ncbi:MAG: TIGR01459 family HAD-type hydrolase [Bosea sp. (in: a-proteobacteria)]|uniref:TIGR01459 family HAD-type hydrolase n=1 Tax=Bosea sp. (in: a-proteobacteria) TaxID=1871050 RepID=UPI0027341E5F|nr:TIGR01459 family HAD-type hydrolase [Bosea sp. (in: a-proteobacteria)]MDP3255706.1 TIGR01459 family HAD-type hydrolase [Bosea sp. (in: a-proteobacteria)]MDP3320563.1 TIGR01459 family HAD-type hydrolase [Bosea sp. (in: a-proteobacteria)]